MRCQWQDLLNLLPERIKYGVDQYSGNDIQEIRLRIGSPPELRTASANALLNGSVNAEDIGYCINMATRYSPWTSASVTEGFITAPGGHRIGLCGECVYDGQTLKNMKTVTSLCIRVARDFDNICGGLCGCAGSLLIVGRPGSGKTTLLRDLIRNVSSRKNEVVAVLDERRELFPYSAGRFCFPTGAHTDILSGCKKIQGMEMVLRTMGPTVIAVDEITSQEDCAALIRAAWCGVRLIATAHSGSKEELLRSKLFSPIIQAGIFDTLIVLHPNKSWREESLRLCY